MNAAKKIILFTWLLLVASLGNVSASTPGATENRFWEKSFTALETRQAEPLETTGRHQENGGVAYDCAPDSLLAADTTVASEATQVGARAPDFIVTPNGEAIPVPEGSVGPTATQSPGIQFNGGTGGNGLAPNVTDVRIMEPNAQNPSGYVNYGSRQVNGGWQSVNPYTGQAISPTSPWWHIPINQ